MSFAFVFVVPERKHQQKCFYFKMHFFCRVRKKSWGFSEMYKISAILMPSSKASNFDVVTIMYRFGTEHSS